MMLRATGLSVRLGTTQALRSVDFEAAPGQVTGLIGANGSGKTTLLRVLAGLQAPDAGSVGYGDATLAEIGAQRLAQDVAYLAQGGVVHWPVRCEALVALGRLPHRRRMGGLSARDRQAIETAMRLTDTLQFSDRTIDQLSGGERMRVLLARALAVEAPVMLADEPIAALDPAHQLDVMTLLRQRAREQATVVVVLHDLSLAVRYCDSLVLMAGGEVLARGAPDAVLTDENLASAFRIRVTRGASDGQSFVVPWSAID